MKNFELCINLWFCFDKETGFVDALAGRGYFLSGTDEQKTALLKALATSDYLNALWEPVPDRFETRLINSATNAVDLFSGVIHASDIDVLGMSLFEEIFQRIESLDQTYVPIKNAVNVKVPDAPLYVMTPVQKSNGELQLV